MVLAHKDVLQAGAPMHWSRFHASFVCRSSGAATGLFVLLFPGQSKLKFWCLQCPLNLRFRGVDVSSQRATSHCG